MSGGLWIALGTLLFAVNLFPPYQNWVRFRLEKKGLDHVEHRVRQRKKLINVLATVYVMTGLALWISPF